MARLTVCTIILWFCFVIVFRVLFGRSIRTNWATRKPASLSSNSNESGSGGGASEFKPNPTSHGSGGGPGGHSSGGGGKSLNYEEVFQQASAMNFTVYCGGISDSDENTIRAAFSPYGRILEIRYFRDKGYAFVRYDNKESACSAIVAVNGTDIGGSSVKCSWGKENAGGQGQGGGQGDYMQRHDMGPPHPHYDYYSQPQQPYYGGHPGGHGGHGPPQMYNNSQYMMQPQYYGNYGGNPNGGPYGGGGGGGHRNNY